MRSHTVMHGSFRSENCGIFCGFFPSLLPDVLVARLCSPRPTCSPRPPCSLFFQHFNPAAPSPSRPPRRVLPSPLPLFPPPRLFPSRGKRHPNGRAPSRRSAGACLRLARSQSPVARGLLHSSRRCAVCFRRPSGPRAFSLRAARSSVGSVICRRRPVPVVARRRHVSRLRRVRPPLYHPSCAWSTTGRVASRGLAPRVAPARAALAAAAAAPTTARPLSARTGLRAGWRSLTPLVRLVPFCVRRIRRSRFASRASMR